MTAKKADPKPETPDESTRPAEIEGQCNRPMTTAEGALDRCYRAAGHKGDHVSRTSYGRAKDKGKSDRAAFSQWREANDPELKAKREAAAAKKLATLKALAAELGYTLAKA